MLRIRLAALLLVAFCVRNANADWILTPYLAGGTQTSLLVNDDDNFTVDFQLKAAPGDLSTGTLQSLLFDVTFSAGGLEYTGYTWAAGAGFESFDSSGVWDYSSPPPTVNTSPTYPVTMTAGTNSVHIESFTTTGFSLPGTVVSLNFHVPTGYSVPSTLITPLPDTFTDDNGDPIGTISGGSFTVMTNVPEPSTVAMLLSGGAVAIGGVVVRRRRQRAAQSAA